MTDHVRIETLSVMAKPFLCDNETGLADLWNMLDEVCSQIAQRFDLYGSNGKPRKAVIVATLSGNACLACIARRFSDKVVGHDVDAMYSEVHRLAVDFLVEELQSLISGMGYKVAVSNEVELSYGKADVIITMTKYGINLKRGTEELLVEVKTGKRFDLGQLFRYLLDGRSTTIVVWRVRRRQVLVFNSQELNPLLIEFMKMCILRGRRLLESSENLACEHKDKLRGWSPTQHELQDMFQDFSKAVMETLPYVLQTILKKLGIEGNRSESKNAA